MSFDRNSTLEQLEGEDLGEPEFNFSLVLKLHELYRKPLSTFTVEDLRLMIGQSLGLPFLIPMALEILESDPLAAGDYYPGDLLSAVLGTSKDFWKENPDLYRRVNDLLVRLPSLSSHLTVSIERFRAQ